MTDNENQLCNDAEILLRKTSPGHTYLGTSWTEALANVGSVADAALALLPRLIEALEEADNERKHLQDRIDDLNATEPHDYDK